MGASSWSTFRKFNQHIVMVHRLPGSDMQHIHDSQHGLSGSTLRIFMASITNNSCPGLTWSARMRQ